MYMSKNLVYRNIFPGIVTRAHFWSPDKLKFLWLYAAFKILLVNPADYDCFKAHLRKKFRIRSRVAEWVKLPADSRCDAKFLHQKVMSCLEVTQDICIVGRRLIVGDQTSMYYLKLALIDQRFDLIFFLLTDFVVIPSEECDVAESVGIRRVLAQLFKNWFQKFKDFICKVSVVCL